ncbi:hypothetical protein FSP39_011681 [Pinctada imbricata]|uniref:Endonuclease/exonuclease/phosphatase domain-containing protein n=1 Tax=Pinctada imbricata TaxID=66713 RepID=A0AA88XZN6_PINIB|nr:hypothetical protein FSP39_011681 [Pinctada imbricata]
MQTLWVKFDRVFFKTVTDVFLCVVYILPNNPSGLKFDEEDIFEILETDIFEFQAKGKVIICGDFNCRTGNLPDCIINDNVENYVFHFEDDTYNEIDAGDQMIRRVSKDTKVNSSGRRLLSICGRTGLRIVNGRIGDDSNIGDFTFCNSQGQSVIDYFLCDDSMFDSVQSFSILSFNEFSMHAPIKFCLNMSYEDTYLYETPQVIHKIVWDSSDDIRLTQFRHLISESVVVFDEMVNEISEPNQECIDSVVQGMSDILYNQAYSVFGKSIRTLPYANKEKFTGDDWFDEKCKQSKRNFNSFRNRFMREPNIENRTAFLRNRKIYNQVKRRARLSHQLKEGKQLADSLKRNPRKFWRNLKRVNSKGINSKNDPFSVNEFFSHFEKLLQGDEGNQSSHMSNNVDDLNDDFLDDCFSVDEVKSAISKLKRNKSVGLDKICAEIFLECNDVLSPVLTKLFNHIYSSGVYPSVWAECVIVPVPKKANPKMLMILEVLL